MFIQVPGAINLRDFGGYHTAGGQQVVRGKLFRCGNMSEISTNAYDQFAALDIGVICDLRSHEEAEESPSPDSPPFDCRVHIPIWPGSSNQFQANLRGRRPDHNEFIEFMNRITREIARDHVESYKQLMTELLQTERGFLLHCSAGKDRTGVGAALILTLLGVDHDTVLKDYLMSNESKELIQRTLRRMQENSNPEGGKHEVDEEVIKVLAGVREEYLLGAFEEIDTHYGGMDGYLESIGITQNEKARLQARLLD